MEFEACFGNLDWGGGGVNMDAVTKRFMKGGGLRRGMLT